MEQKKHKKRPEKVLTFKKNSFRFKYRIAVTVIVTDWPNKHKPKGRSHEKIISFFDRGSDVCVSDGAGAGICQTGKIKKGTLKSR